MTRVAEHLIGRTAELATIDAALARLGHGRAPALEIVGEPGLGKTRLLSELGARAEGSGMLVLAGSASELEDELPFWVFVDALDEYVRGLEPRRLDAVEHDLRTELGNILPGLRTPVATSGERHRAHQAVRRLLEELATQRPLVLLLDDLHWADPGSIELLGALLRRPPDGRVLIALALRPRQRPERLSGPLERAVREGSLTRLELAPFTAAEASELLGVPDAAELNERAGGNPFYLEQLARSAHGRSSAGDALSVVLSGTTVPVAVADALADELALLPASGRRVLDGAAVAGDPFEPELAAAAADTDETTVADALDELIRRDLVRTTDVPRRFRFRHPLVRSAVYAAAPAGWLLGAHERVAALLATRGVPAAERAHHVERAARHGDMAAVAVLREAGESATARAPVLACKRFTAALRLLGPDARERVPLLEALAGTAVVCGRFGEAHAATLECLALLPEDAMRQRVGVTALCASIELLLGQFDEAHERLTATLGRLTEGSREAAEMMMALATDGFYRRDYREMRAWSERALESARALDDRPLHANAAGLLALAGTLEGTVADAEAACAEAAAAIAGVSDEEVATSLQGLNNLAAAELHLGRLTDASLHTERALAVARATGRGEMVPVLYWAGTVRTARGQLREAIEVFDAAIEICRLTDHAATLAWNLHGRSFAATAAGDVATALATAEESVELLSGSKDDVLPASWAGFALAAALELDGQPARAAETLLRAAGGEDLPDFPATWRPWGFELLTRCRLASGRPQAAARDAAAAEDAATGLGLPMPRYFAHRAAAAVALDAGDAASAAEHALAAAATAARLDAVLQAAHARVIAGRALAAAGEMERAAVELQHAAAEFEVRGALPYRDAAERQLRRLGHRRLHRRTRPGTGTTGIESLTERELQVARLVVDRRTNPQIAAELYLSQKTVETHIRNVFNKLGVSSRVEVARVVERADRAAANDALGA